MFFDLFDSRQNKIATWRIANTNLSKGDSLSFSSFSDSLRIWNYIPSPSDYFLCGALLGTESRHLNALENIGWHNNTTNNSLGLSNMLGTDFTLYLKNNSRIRFRTQYSNTTLYAPDGSSINITSSYGAYAICNSVNGLTTLRFIAAGLGTAESPYWTQFLYCNNENTAFLEKFLNGAIEYEPTDPYIPGGISDEGGGNGDFDDTSDAINVPLLPTLSAISTGFINMYNPTVAQLTNLSDYMWNNDLFDVDTWKKIFNNPMDAILGLTIVPVTPQTSGLSAVKIGNLTTNIEMPLIYNQFVEVDCGSININEYWGAYLDYAPYTKIELYLPYCGTHSLNIDDIMGKSLGVKYHIDILSGAMCVYVTANNTVLYTFTGQCASSLPVTANNMTNVINGIMGVASSAVSMVASGGLTIPAMMGSVGSMATSVMGSKPHVEKSGSMSGTSGLMAVQTPYIIITRPNQCLPQGQNEYLGYPSFITRKVDDLSGYTEFADIHLVNISATDNEKSEMLTILKGGVIL